MQDSENDLQSDILDDLLKEFLMEKIIDESESKLTVEEINRFLRTGKLDDE